MIDLAWGGFTDEDSSDYLKKIAIADKIMKYLVDLKRELSNEEQVIVEKTIQIICDFIEKLRQ